jgi:8-oxo-dGTP diphosphatase
MKPKFTLGAFAIITNEDNQVLLCLRNDYPIWNLPGGGVENSETPWDCVVREVKEETGLNVSVDRLIGIYSKVESDDLVFLFKCKYQSGVLLLNDEAGGFKYCDLENIPSNTIPKQVERIKDCFQADNSNKVVMKTQVGKSVQKMITDGEMK